MRSLRIVLTLIAVAFATMAFPRDFLSKEEPTRLFDIGLRLGVNSSNRTFPKGVFNQWDVNSWGTGVDAGCVVDINIRDFISIQPGLFVETRSGNYAYAHTFYESDRQEEDFTQLGHDRSANVTIPILASMKFDITEALRIIAEAGPYVQWYLHDSASGKITVIAPQYSPSDPIVVSTAKPAALDAGLKAGIGFSYLRKYSLHFHYLAGGTKAWEGSVKGGANKSWLITIGYTL